MIHKTRNFRLLARCPPGATIGEWFVEQVDVRGKGEQ